MPLYDKNCENCFWWQTFSCEGKTTESGCKHHFYYNEDPDKFNEMTDQYQAECAEAIAPVNEKYHNMFLDFVLN